VGITGAGITEHSNHHDSASGIDYGAIDTMVA